MLGKTKFNNLLQCLITLKEKLDNEVKMTKYTESIKKIQNHKVDLFTKFIGLDKHSLECEFVFLYNHLYFDMKKLQFDSVITKNQSIKMFDLFPKNAKIH